MNPVDLLIPPIPVEERSQLEIGTEVEKEHFRGGKPVDTTPRKVAQTHIGENPRYYPTRPKPKGAKERLIWTKEGMRPSRMQLARRDFQVAEIPGRRPPKRQKSFLRKPPVKIEPPPTEEEIAWFTQQGISRVNAKIAALDKRKRDAEDMRRRRKWGLGHLPM